MPSASSAVHTEIKTMSSVSANMVLISPVCPRAPTLRGGKALQSQRDREETWRDRPSRSATTLTAPSLHFRFRGADPELQASLPPSGRHSRERAATLRSSRRGWRGSLRKAEASFGLVWNILHLSILGPLVLRQRVLRSPGREAPLVAHSVKCCLWRVWTGHGVSLCPRTVKGLDLVTYEEDIIKSFLLEVLHPLKGPRDYKLVLYRKSAW